MNVSRTSKAKGRFGLIKGFTKRFVLLLLVYMTVMVSLWTTLGQFFVDGIGLTWIFWLTLSLSLVAFIGFIIYVEYQQIKYYGHP
jgi:hypothetical protein